LYAKGHYKKSDILSDLTEIHANWSGIDQEYISYNDIGDVLIHIIYPLVKNNESRFYDLIYSLCRSEQTPLEDFLKIMRYATKEEFGELGEPDSNILPLSREKE